MLDGLQPLCKPCSIERMRQYRGANPQRSIFNNKKAGAKKTGVKFALVYENVVWNTICPVLGIELNYTRNSGLGRHPHPNSPSFDRIDPKKGYTPDNVIIVSHLANTIKSNATVDQLERVASFYRQFIPLVGASHV